MKIAQLLLLVSLFSVHSLTIVRSDNSDDKLLEAMQSSDVALFRELLAIGEDPNTSASNEWFRFTSSCESTKKGNNEFFEAIVESGAPLDLVSPLGGFTGSMIACAIFYNNFETYQRLLDLDVDINTVQNPAAHDSRLFMTPIDIAVMANRFRITMDILERIEPTESQIRTLVRTVNQTPGIKGHPEQPYRDQLADWLKSKGYNNRGIQAK